MIHVVSTGLAAPTRERCLLSISAQTAAHAHHYVEASLQDPPLDVITNQASVISKLAPEDIVAFVDGDDWLAHPKALEAVQYLHDAGAWVTWGSFEFADGRPGFASAIDHSRPIRAQEWRTTHLKTIRAGLFQRLREEDLKWPPGAAVPWDMVVMFAAIEMAGWERVARCREVLYIYNFRSSHEFSHGPGEERRIEQVIRARDPYPLLETLR